MTKCAQCGKNISWWRRSVIFNNREFCSEACKDAYRAAVATRLAEAKAEKQRKRIEEAGRRKAEETERERKAKEEGWAQEELIRKLEEKIAAEPQNGQLYFELGELLEKLGKEEKLSDVYSKAITLGLRHPKHRGKAYHILADLRQAQEGVLDYSFSLAHMRELAAGHWADKGISYSDVLGREYLENAARELRLALRSEPDNMELLKELAMVFQKLGATKERGKVLAEAEKAKVRKELKMAIPQSKPELSPFAKGVSFEERCLRLIEAMGFEAQSTKHTADGGIDIVAMSRQPLIAGRYIVQCKDWHKPVGEPVVRDLYGVVASEMANKGILIASGGFTEAAQDFAKGKQLELIDSEQLDELCRTHLQEETDA